MFWIEMRSSEEDLAPLLCVYFVMAHTAVVWSLRLLCIDNVFFVLLMAFIFKYFYPHLRGPFIILNSLL